MVRGSVYSQEGQPRSKTDSSPVQGGSEQCIHRWPQCRPLRRCGRRRKRWGISRLLKKKNQAESKQKSEERESEKGPRREGSLRCPGAWGRIVALMYTWHTVSWQHRVFASSLPQVLCEWADLPRVMQEMSRGLQEGRPAESFSPWKILQEIAAPTPAQSLFWLWLNSEVTASRIVIRWLYLFLESN